MQVKHETVDLHTHTNASDGKLSPKALYALAKEKGLKALAITDHDTLDGVRVLLDSPHDNVTEIIAGVEMSVSFEPVMHVLGLFTDINNESLSQMLTKTCNKKKKLLVRAIQLLRKRGIDFGMAELKAGTIVSINGLIKHLTEKELFSSAEEGKAFFEELHTEWMNTLPKPKECFEAIHRAGGIAILAHPLFLGLTNDELRKLIVELKGIGLDGIEIIHPEQEKEYRDFLYEVAKENELLMSGGSDFHGKPGQFLLAEAGSEMQVDYDTVLRMKEKARGYRR